MAIEVSEPLLPLTPDELLTTTRAVRKRLDLTRPVPRELIEDCICVAQQAPGGGVRQSSSFVVVVDRAKREALGEVYRRGVDDALSGPAAPHSQAAADPSRANFVRRYLDSARHLRDHIQEVPVLVIPCFSPRADHLSVFGQATKWGIVLPATWSLMLAARARGLGSAWTTAHLHYEREAAEILGIPYADVEQAALIPVAYAVGTNFKPGFRAPLEQIVHWDTW